MIDDAPAFLRRSRRRRPRSRVLLKTAIVALFVATFPRLTGLEAPPPAATTARLDDGASSPNMTPPVASAYAWMLDPSPIMGGRTPGLLLAVAEPVRTAVFEPPAAAILGIARVEAEPRPHLVQQTARLVPPMPAPVPRPAEFRSGSPAQRLALRRSPSRLVAARQNAEAERSFFDTVFGRKEPDPSPALAYASADTDAVDLGRRRVLDRVPSSAGGGTAIYDISAGTVTLPSGDQLEAHSGLGPHFDNPRTVHIRMRGSTPPGTYDLTEREALFHGVRALRLNPVGGSAAIHGRDGILAHTYMLGPSGASNGCVVFKDYNRFLQAYLRGEVRRIVVVPGHKGDAPSSLTARLFGR